jgi:hypothetical protein
MNRLERSRTGIWILAAVLFAPTLALAQDKPVTFNIGAGVVLPQGEVADRFDAGFTFPVGLTGNITETVGIHGEYSYHWMNGPDGTLETLTGPELLETNHTMHVGNANVKFTPVTSGPVGGYVLGGVGVYHRSVELTSPAVGLGTVCDPWYYVCYPVPVEVDQILGTRSTTDFGLNFGGAITFGRRFYVEARYHYVYGPEIEQPQSQGGGTVKANGYYIPINFGFLF